MGDERKVERRGAWRAAILWGAALAALAFGAVWTATSGWRYFHLAYCRRLMASADDARQLEGIMKAAAVHLRPGLARDEVRGIFAPARLDGPLEGSAGEMKLSKTGEGFYLAHPMALADGVALVFDADDRLVKWWTVP